MKTKTLLVSVLCVVVTALCAWLIFGCTPRAPYDCSNEALAELEARFAAELLATCQHAPSVAKCPEADQVIAKYDALREDWTKCR